MESPLVVIVGPTASGKSALAMEIARSIRDRAALRLEAVPARQRDSQASRTSGTLKRDSQTGGPEMSKKPAGSSALQIGKLAGLSGAEIICADSRTIYRGMDIGTAKPSQAEQAEIPHHVLDVIEPSEHFTAAEFKRQALEAIEDITSRNKLPIMAGGTGLYIDGVIFDFSFLPAVAPHERERLQQMPVQELQAEISRLGLPLPENSQNPRHLMRVLETNGTVPVKKGLRANTLVIGIDIDRETVRERIVKRVDAMVQAGFETEVQTLHKLYGRDAPGLLAPGYKAFGDYAAGRLGLDEAKQRFIDADCQLAKRQRTWFRRNPHIKWIKSSSEALKLVQTFLQQNTAK